MKKLLHYQPALTSKRIMLAFVVAILADVIQIPVNFGLTYFPQLRLLNYTVDALTTVLTIGLLGFHWALLPGLVCEVLPLSLAMPGWTAAVVVVVWRRSATQPNAPQPQPTEVPQATPNAASPQFFNPFKRFVPLARRMFHPRTAGLWILLLTTGLIAGLIYHNHRQGRHGPLADWFPTHPTSYDYTPTTEPFEFVPNSVPQGKPTVTVAPITIQIQSKHGDEVGVHPDRIRFLVEECLSRREDVDLVPSSPLTASQPVTTDRVLFVSLLDMQDEAATFTGYNIATRTLATKCALRVQLIHAARRTTLFSAVLEGSQTEAQTKYAKYQLPPDRILGAVNDALKKLAQNAAFTRALQGPTVPSPATTH